MRNISESIRCIGVDDLSIKLFENQYPTPRGISYNSYLIVDEKVALLDTIDAGCRREWIYNMHSQLGARTPDYLVVHHMEPDHSACLEEAMVLFPKMQLVCSRQSATMLPQFCPGADYSERTIVVKEGDTLSLGKHELRFLAAPMVHWPEVLVSYESNERVLFSADAFGKFGAVQLPDDWVGEARRYYINIVGKYGPQTQALLRKVAGLDIATIAPLHGPIIDGDIAACVELYDTWSSYRPELDGVLVAFASIYGNTAACARQLAAMLRQRGNEVVEMDLCACDQSEAVAQAFRLSEMVVAAPTYDAGIYPPMARFLHHLRIKNYQNRKVGIIENGTWAPISGKLMAQELQAMKGIEIVAPTVTLRTKMAPASLEALEQLAEAL